MAVSQALPLLLVMYGVVRCAVFNDVATVTQARCYANCITKVSQSAEPDHGCHGNACRQCVSPCGRKWTTIASCKTACGSSVVCHKSCEFLEYLKSLPNVLDGNHSLTSHPGVPMATAKTVQNLTLSWQPVSSSVGSVVYLLKKSFRGDIKGKLKDLKNLVFTHPRAVLDATNVCQYASPYRYNWNGVQFTFQVVALTEYSHLVASSESTKIEMTRPEPVLTIGMPSFVYDKNAFGDKLKITTTVTPFQAQVDLISQYAMEWSMSFCAGTPFVPPRSSISRKASTTISMYLYEKLKACNHTLKVYSLNQCIPSLPRTLTYEYKGCNFVSNFNQSFCYSFDPPPTPDSVRAVSSLAYSPLKATNDFRFSTNVTWFPPTFPYGKVQSYSYAYGDVTKILFGVFWMAKRGTTMKTSLEATNLEPNITVRVEVKPYFPNAVGVVKKVVFRTPGIPEDQIVVQRLTANDCVFSPASLYSVRIHWEKPVFHNQLKGYQIEFLKGNSSRKTIKTTETFHVFQGLLHNEPLVVEVKPLYRVSWIKPKYVVLQLKAPVPYDEDMIVKHLSINNFTLDAQTNTFTAYFSWDPPSYSLKTVDYYKVEYAMIGGNGQQEITCPTNNAIKAKLCMPTTTKESRYTIPRLHPHVHIIISVKPVFQNSPFLNGIKATYTVNVPFGPVLFCDGKPAGYHADVEDCTAFYNCDANGGTFHLFCPAGLYWNNRNQTCDLPQNVNCHENNQSCCQGKPEGYYKVEKNHAAYCVCDGKGRGFLRMCTSGLYWNEGRRACDLPKFHQHYQDDVTQ